MNGAQVRHETLKIDAALWVDRGHPASRRRGGVPGDDSTELDRSLLAQGD